MRDIEHTIDVTAETLYEAIAAALAALQQDSWVEEIAQGLNTISVLVQQPPVKHEVKMKDFLSWLDDQEVRLQKWLLERECARFW
jgi:hypothetical protein